MIIVSKKGKNSLLIKILLSNLQKIEVKYLKDNEFFMSFFLNKLKNYDFILISTRLKTYINKLIFKNNIKYIFDNSSRIFERIDRRIPSRLKYIYRDIDYKKNRSK